MQIPRLKLKTKLTIINSLSKVLIIVLAIFVVPSLVSDISIKDTDNKLYDKLDQIYSLIEEEGIEQFSDTEAEFQAFGSYNILKEEFVSIELTSDTSLYESIGNVIRIIEEEEIDYRVISASLQYGENYYLIEIGKSISVILNFEKKLQSITLYFLLILFSISIIIDLILTQILLQPFGKIIQKLKSITHPSSFEYSKVSTSTDDFIYLEESIHSLMHKIEDAFNSEREFIGNISHELLTPISIIRTKLDNFTSNANLPDEEVTRIFEVKTSLVRLTKMVRSLLLLSRLENEEYIISEKVDLHDLLNNVTNEIKDRIDIKGLELDSKLTADSHTINGNKELLHILFFNLLNNAVKYTPSGKIIIQSFYIDSTFNIEISDTGKGIANEHLPHIFSRFRKFQDGESNFGLGLALAKKICDYHHINIDVESKVGSGSKFILGF